MNVASCSRASASCICARLGRRRQDDDSAAIAHGHGGRGEQVAVVTIDPAQAARQLARARRSSATSRGSSTPSASPSTASRCKGELWAMMLDAKRTFDELIERHAPDERDARRDPRQPHLPGALERDGRLAGVHGDGEALRARPGGRLRPARARHAAVAQRARLPRRARAADALHRGPRAAGLPARRPASACEIVGPRHRRRVLGR